MEDHIKKDILFIYTLTPLHVGVGSTPEVVDLPIQREKTTGFPTIFGSSLKGAIRSNFDEDTARSIFGNDDPQKEPFASAVSFTDARILLFPVKSLKGIFVYVTCPFVLRRLERELKIMEISSFSGNFSEDAVYVVKGMKEKLLIGGKLVLDEIAYDNVKEMEEDVPQNILELVYKVTDGNFSSWYNRMKSYMVVIPDEDFRFLVKHGTEVVTRIKINPDTGTVERRALWTEENVPSDTLFYSIVIFDSKRAEDSGRSLKDLYKLDGKSINIGGNTTIGRGFVYLKFKGGKDASN